MRWLAWWGGGPGGVAGQVGGWPGDRRGVDLLSKECSGVNIAT